MTLRASNVIAGYNASRDNVLRDVSCDFHAGHVTVIAGPNGAGKSTLLRVLLGVMHASTGTVSLDGTPLAAMKPPLRARHIAYMPQRTSLAFAFRVVDVVAFGALGVAQSRAVELATLALRDVGLADRANEPFASLSVGQQQRATLARALAQLRSADTAPGTRVLLADEPVSAQDPASALRMCELLVSLAREQTLAVVCVMHDLTLARRIADDCLLLTCEGRVAATGPAHNVLTPVNLADVFGVQFAEIRVESGGISVPTIVPVGPQVVPASRATTNES